MQKEREDTRARTRLSVHLPDRTHLPEGGAHLQKKVGKHLPEGEDTAQGGYTLSIAQGV